MQVQKTMFNLSYPFGMLMPGRKFNSGDYKFGFNGKWNDNSIKGIGNTLNFEARIYDSRIGRWFTVDPDFRNFASNSVYLSFSDNPINRIDPTGRGDFYSQKGIKLGSDGINDGKNYVVTDKKSENLIRKNDKSNLKTQVAQVSSSIIQLPSAYVRSRMGDAVDRSQSTYDGHLGGQHEEGGFACTNRDGQEVVVDAVPGPNTLPPNEATVKVYNANNKEELVSATDENGNSTVFLEFHMHPSYHTEEINYSNPLADPHSATTAETLGGTTTTKVKGFNTGPTNPDDYETLGSAKSSHLLIGDYGYVLSPKNNTVTIYTENGNAATFPLDKFREIGNCTSEDINALKEHK